jgi:hypothetical protein
MQGFDLDFVALGLEFVVPGLDFVAKNLDFVAGNSEILHRAGAPPCTWGSTAFRRFSSRRSRGGQSDRAAVNENIIYISELAFVTKLSYIAQAPNRSGHSRLT